MITRSAIGVALASVAAGIGSYFATVSLAQRSAGPSATPACPRGLAAWLSLTRQQQERIGAADPAFMTDYCKLRQEAGAAKESLADTLAKDSAPDDEIMSKVERAIEADSQLERRCARHLLKVKSILTPDQRRQLLDVSAEQIRQGCSRYCGQRGGAGEGVRGPGGRGGGGGSRQGPPWRDGKTGR